MTDRIPRPDELASAYLDGETTPAETALVEQDAALTARAEELRTARDAVSAGVPALPVEDRERMLAAAMAAADKVLVPSSAAEPTGVVMPSSTPEPTGVVVPSSAPEPTGVVVPLRRRFSRPLLSAAAAVALVAAVVGAGLLAGRLGDSDNADVALEMAESSADADHSVATTEAHESARLDSGAGPDEEAFAEYDEMSEPTIDEADDAAGEEFAAELAPEAAMADPAEAAPETAMADPDDTTAETATADDELGTDPEIKPDDAVSDGQPSRSTPSTEGAPADQPGFEPQEIPVLALGLFDSIDALVETVAARSQTQDGLDGVRAESGPCSEAVRDHAQSIGAEIVAAFVAMLDETTQVSVDLVSTRRDGALGVVYAVGPDCAPVLLGLDESGGK